jgi:hypothetical protein
MRAGEEMETGKIQFTRASDLRNEQLRSLILMAHKDGEEIAELFCLDKDWTVLLSIGKATIQISWEDFIEIFYQFSLFVANQNKSMLRECEENQATENGAEL